jgi:coatomer subunit gamma
MWICDLAACCHSTPNDLHPQVVVVDAIRALCLKFPSKNRALLNFLSHMLREEGGYEFKRAIVDALLVLMNAIPDVREPALLHLAEFIEDCEFTQLATQARVCAVPCMPLLLPQRQWVRARHWSCVRSNPSVLRVDALVMLMRGLPGVREPALLLFVQSSFFEYDRMKKL